MPWAADGRSYCGSETRSNQRDFSSTPLPPLRVSLDSINVAPDNLGRRWPRAVHIETQTLPISSLSLASLKNKTCSDRSAIIKTVRSYHKKNSAHWFGRASEVLCRSSFSLGPDPLPTQKKKLEVLIQPDAATACEHQVPHCCEEQSVAV